MSKKAKIPKATITRLSFYSRQLELLEFDGYRMVSSEKLAWLCQVNPAQVRKDLGYFGDFGIRGVGYDVRDLNHEIKKILAVNREWNMAIVGIGNLGSALIRYQNFATRGFHIVAAFDADSRKIGHVVGPNLIIQDMIALKRSVQELGIKIGIIATPPSVAQNVADALIDADVRAILNFSPVQLQIPDHTRVEHIDFTVKLDVFTYKLTHGEPSMVRN
jgi:redox-sensing transcriptional repressor